MWILVCAAVARVWSGGGEEGRNTRSGKKRSSADDAEEMWRSSDL